MKKKERRTAAAAVMPPLPETAVWHGHEIKELTFAQKGKAFASFAKIYEDAIKSNNGEISPVQIAMELAGESDKFIPLCVPTLTNWGELKDDEKMEIVLLCNEVNNVGDFIYNFFTRVYLPPTI